MITNINYTNNEKLQYSTQNANEYSGIYCFTYISNRPDDKHLIKIGKFTMANQLDMNDERNRKNAEARIKQIPSPIDRVYGDKYELNWYYPAIFKDTQNTFTDKAFHNWLRKNLGNNINRKYPDSNSYSEVFNLTAEKARYYFKQFINHEPLREPTSKEKYFSIIQEQEEGINKLTNFWKKCYSNPNSKNIFLFNAIMRFGKCITTYEFIRKNNDIKHILILSHRPDVFNSWKDDYEDYLYHFCNEKKYKIWEKKHNETLESFNKSFNYIISFVSIQDLRGLETIKQDGDEIKNEQEAQEIALKFKQNNQEIFDFQWDLVVIDEAHEGLLTKLAAKMFNNFTNKPKMYILLSGTPFNLKSYGEQIYDEMDKFNESNSFEYSFLDEQKQQESFLKKYKKEYMQIMRIEDELLSEEQKKLKYQYQYYQDIPKLRLLTTNVVDPSMKNAYKNEYFGFSKFFELTDDNKFVDEQAIDNFLNKLCSDDQKFINYPYSKECRKDTQCAMWMLPSVKVANALEKKLKNHPFFSHYNIWNVTGKEYDSSNDFTSLKNDVDKIDNKIIILSFKRLTTGVTLKGLSTILFLNDSESLISYYQTMFRVKNPYPLNWKNKKKKIGLIFDFNTFRCLNNTYELANKCGKNNQANEEKYNKIINYFDIYQLNPNIIDLTKISVNNLTQQANKAIVAAAYNSGCLKIRRFFDVNNCQDINKIINKLDGYSYSKSKNQDIVVNKTTGKPILLSKKTLTVEEKKKIQKEKIELHKIMGIFVKIPILMLGMYDKLHKLFFKKNVSNPSFDQLFNEEMISIEEWKSIMSPNSDATKCIEKKDFKELCSKAKPGIFIETFKTYLRNIEVIFSYTSPLEREKQWNKFFQKIQNPNKETVFTPYSVIKLQYDKANINWYNAYRTKQKFLDLYAKEALYSYYAACRLYEQAIKNEKLLNQDKVESIWHKIIYNQIFCCQNAMFLTIAQKILGFNNECKNLCQINVLNKLNNK